jgi:prepilin-type N-terminal cleavage/methylation domain-containing protein
VQRNGFTLLEILIVISIIAFLFSIIVPCLMTAKDRALELNAMQVGVDDEGRVRLEIRNLSNRKLYEDIYMIEINPPRRCRISLKKPYPSGMKLINRDGQDYIKWRPKVKDIGVHFITVVFEGEKTSEREITVFVYNQKLLDAQREAEEENSEE